MTIVYERTYRVGMLGHTYICDGGALGNLTVPASFTDRGPEPESQRLTVETLAELARLMAAIGAELDRME